MEGELQIQSLNFKRNREIETKDREKGSRDIEMRSHGERKGQREHSKRT